MRIHLIWPLWAVAALLAPPAGASERPAVWPLVEELLRDHAAPLPEVPADDAPVFQARAFLFERLREVEPEALIRAAAYVAVRGQGAVAQGRTVEDELGVVFEYYPVIASGEGDRARLYDAMLDNRQPAALRRFLILAGVPGTGAPSAFCRYMRRGLEDGALDFQKSLMGRLTFPGEDPSVLEGAVALLPVLVADGFRAAEGDGERLERQRQIGGAVAAGLESLTRDPARPEALRAAAGQAAASLRETWPLPGPEALVPEGLPASLAPGVAP